VKKETLQNIFIETLLISFLMSCGGSSPSGQPPVPTYSISGSINGMDNIRNIGLSLNSENLTVSQNGSFSFNQQLIEGSAYAVNIEREPARQDCTIANETGVIGQNNVNGLEINCSNDESAPLFSLDRLHKIRLTMTYEEWKAFELDTLRSNYSINDASGPALTWTSWTHSEIYRQADFDYLDDQGGVLGSVPKVGFKMQGNTSRQYPVDYESNPAQPRPRRFSFAIKFDEKFDEDESVYACIDANGTPASVGPGLPCLGIVAQNIPEYPEADDRVFMGVEKLRFRFNRDDPSYQREVLTHQLLNQIGVPVARATHAQVELVITGAVGQTLYGQALPQTYNMGVFIMMEQVDKPYLKRYFDKNNYLFKVGAPGNLAGAPVVASNCDPYEDRDSATFFNANFCVIGVEKSDPDSAEEWLGTANYLNPNFVNTEINKKDANGNAIGNVSQFLPYKPTYDLKSKKKSIADARIALREFAQFLQTNPPPSVAELGQKFDIPGFIKAQAAEIVVGAVDHYVRVANNYYLYFNEHSNKWVYMPNDFDYTFIDVPGSDCDNNPTLNACTPLNYDAFTDIIEMRAFPSGNNPYWAGEQFYPNDPPILWNLVFSEQSNKAALYQEIQSILDEFFNWSIVGPLLQERKNRLDQAILSTDAAIRPANLDGGSGCADAYNPEEIEGNEAGFCNPARASIKRFIDERRVILQQEINAN
jgi:hypothetical protein